MADLRTCIHAPRLLKPIEGLGPKSMDAILCNGSSVVSLGSRGTRTDDSGCGLKEDQHV